MSTHGFSQNLPNHDDSMESLRYHARETALSVLDTFCDSNTFPVDPFLLAQELGIEVIHYYFYVGEFEGYFLPAMTSGNTYGAPKVPTEPSVGNRYPQIFVNQRRTLQRQRFIAAHELGHFFENKSVQRFDKLQNISSSQSLFKQEEIFANTFALELLMPEFTVKQLYRAGGSDKFLSDFFGVSRITMTDRLEDLGLAPYRR